MFDEARPEVVHILTPPQTHASLALRALDAGCHVFVEKPMATSAQDAEAMLASARAKGLTLCVDHNRLFDPVVERAREMVERGTIGQVVSRTGTPLNIPTDTAALWPCTGLDFNWPFSHSFCIANSIAT